MKLVHNLLLLTFFTCIQFVSSQESEVYLFFDSSSSETCKIDIEGEGEQTVFKYRKENTKCVLYFYICDKVFTFLKKEYKTEIISKRKFKRIIFKSSDLITRDLVMDYKPIIYIVQKEGDKYCKYRVGFIHSFISVD